MVQIDNLREMPKDKRPPDEMIWEGTGDELSDWLDRIYSKTKSPISEFVINEKDIE